MALSYGEEGDWVPPTFDEPTGTDATDAGDMVSTDEPAPPPVEGPSDMPSEHPDAPPAAEPASGDIVDQAATRLNDVESKAKKVGDIIENGGRLFQKGVDGAWRVYQAGKSAVDAARGGPRSGSNVPEDPAATAFWENQRQAIEAARYVQAKKDAEAAAARNATAGGMSAGMSRDVAARPIMTMGGKVAGQATRAAAGTQTGIDITIASAAGRADAIKRSRWQAQEAVIPRTPTESGGIGAVGWGLGILAALKMFSK